MMSAGRSLLRKANRVIGDPILRRWLIDRALRRATPEVARRRAPAYLSGIVLEPRETLATVFPDLDQALPTNPINIVLPGETLRLNPTDAGRAFERDFADTESLLALHRFAWVPLAGASVDAAWVGALWRAWLKNYSQPNDSWAWHPYTAAERLVNILAFARVHGVPGPRVESLEALARHGAAIFERLEYFGENQTGNHLANNGRALYLAGLSLQFDDWSRAGLRILLEEARRIFGSSGILREGSSHYHLLVTRWYYEAWQAAREHKRVEESGLRQIVQRALAVSPYLLLPGGMPLIGDVSPDAPPDLLAEWSRAVSGQFDHIPADALVADGWIRHDADRWHGLWYLAPDGWPPMPGHGHQDCGSFELHHGTTPIFCDLGRRSYETIGETDVAAHSHNTLMVDEVSAYPPNKPYYSADFRRRVAGPAPTLRRDGTAIVLECAGFMRLNGVGAWRRTWHFDDDRMVIEDRLEGHGRHKVVRHLHTTLPVMAERNGLRVGEWHVASEGQGTIEPVQYWECYGSGRPASRLRFSADVMLPYSTTIVVVRR